MPGILDFLKSNPELAFKLLQVGGASLQNTGDQFDDARNFNSQNRANRTNSLIGALSQGRIPGMAQSSMRGPGFLSTLGQGMSTAGMMGSSVYDLKREKEDRKYLEEQRLLNAERERLSMDVLAQEKKQNEAILAGDVNEKAMALGKKEFMARYTVGLKEWQKTFRAKGVEPPAYDPSEINKPDSMLKDKNQQAGWDSAFATEFGDYKDEQFKHEEMVIKRQTLEINKIDAQRALAAAQRTGNAQTIAEAKMKLGIGNTLRNTAEQYAKEMKLPEMQSSFGRLSAAYSFKDQNGMAKPNDELLIKTGERMANEGNQVTLAEFRTGMINAMSWTGNVATKFRNTGLWPDEQPMLLNQPARDRIMGIFTKAYTTSMTMQDQKIAEMANAAQIQAYGIGMDFPMEELLPLVKHTRVGPEMAAPYKHLFDGAVESSGITELKGMFETRRIQKLNEGPQSTQSDSQGFGGDTLDALPEDGTGDSVLHGGIGSVLPDAETMGGLGTMAAFGAAGTGAAYGGYKGLKNLFNKFGKPGEATPSAAPIFDTPAGDAVPPAMGGAQSDYMPTGYITDAERRGSMNYDPNAGGTGFDTRASNLEAPAVGRPRPNIPNFSQNTRSGPSSPLNARNIAPDSPGIDMSKYDASNPMRNAYPDWAAETTSMDRPSWESQRFPAPSAEERLAQQVASGDTSPSVLARLMKNPALAKALGYMNTFGEMTGGWAGGLVDTGFLDPNKNSIRDLVRRGMYGRGSTM